MRASFVKYFLPGVQPIFPVRGIMLPDNKKSLVPDARVVPAYAPERIAFLSKLKKIIDTEAKKRPEVFGLCGLKIKNKLSIRTRIRGAALEVFVAVDGKMAVKTLEVRSDGGMQDAPSYRINQFGIRNRLFTSAFVFEENDCGKQVGVFFKEGDLFWTYFGHAYKNGFPGENVADCYGGLFKSQADSLISGWDGWSHKEPKFLDGEKEYCEKYFGGKLTVHTGPYKLTRMPLDMRMAIVSEPKLPLRKVSEGTYEIVV